MAFVPLACSDQFTPGCKATLLARDRKSSSPMLWMMVPALSHSTTMLSVPPIWSASISITGAAWLCRRRLRSRATTRSGRPSGA